jgi:hypothetical protein
VNILTENVSVSGIKSVGLEKKKKLSGSQSSNMAAWIMSQQYLKATHVRGGVNEEKCVNTLTKLIIGGQFYKMLTTPSEGYATTLPRNTSQPFPSTSSPIHYSLTIQHPTP